jgi:hypothetical protein
VDGQCWISTSHSKLDGETAPVSGSSASPEKSIVWPTVHVRDACGVRIVAVGGELPGETRIGSLM